MNDRTHLIAADYPAIGQKNPAARSLNWALYACLCALLGFGPLAFGAVQEWAICTLEVGAAVCVFVWAAGKLVSGHVELGYSSLFYPIVLFAVLVSLQLISGDTAYWFITWRSALLWASYGMIIFVVVQILSQKEEVRAFAFFLVVYGFLIALFAIIQQFTWNGRLYWVVPNRQSGWVYGPYVDHAHYAGLMEMLVPFPLVLAMMNRWQRPQRVLLGFVALLMASTIFLARSLGGIVAFSVQLLFFAILIGVRQRSRRQLLLLFVFSALLALWLGTLSQGGITERIVRLQDPLGKAGAGDRVRIVKDSMKMIAARPAFGWGLGTFPVVYPSFRSFYTNFFVNAAHNDYVQVAVETGLAGFALVCWFIVLFYRASLARVANWRMDVRSAVTLASIVGVTGILIHSLSDFNLQIPANAAMFFTLTALATGSFSRRPVKKPG